MAPSASSTLPAEGRVSREVVRATSPPSRPRFEEVYEQHFELVWRGLRAQGLDGAALDDAVQDVFLVVHRQLPSFEQRSAVSTWLYGIVRHVACNHRRRQQRKGGARPLPEAVPSFAPSPDQIVSDRESLRRVQQALARLDDDKRQVFVLCELEQLRVPEAAQTLGIKLNTAYSRLRAARRAFVRALTTSRGDVR